MRTRLSGSTPSAAGGGSGRYTPEYLAQLAAHPDVAFVLPRTRSIAATMDLIRGEGEGRARNVVLEFKDFETARAYLFSPEYAEARKVREGAGEIDLVARRLTVSELYQEYALNAQPA